MTTPNRNDPLKADAFVTFFADAENRLEYHVELAKLQFARDLVARMEALKINRKQLAERMGVRPSFITRILSGTHNFELESMVRIAKAVDATLCTHLQPVGSSTRWFDIFARTEASTSEQPSTASSLPPYTPSENHAEQVYESLPLAS